MFKRISKNLKKEWDNFVNKFTPEYIGTMQKEDYVEGLPGRKDTFCYIVENKLNDLGNIHGANAFKFGLYYGKVGDETTKEFRYIKKYKNPDDAWSKIQNDLILLINETKKLTEFKNINALSNGMFKYKIMYLYNPDIMIPSFVEGDLIYFLEKEGEDPSKNYKDLQNQIIQLMKTKYSKFTNTHDFACYLYNTYGRPISKKEIDKNDFEDIEVNKKVWKEKVGDLKKFKDEPINRTKVKTYSSGKDCLEYYPRDPKVARIALELAHYKCEHDENHKSFLRRRDKKQYCEVHHLIPLCFYDYFDKSLDVPANIVSLCSECHNEIHYGLNADELIKKLYNQRIKRLKDVGLNISEQDLLNMYHKINQKD